MGSIPGIWSVGVIALAAALVLLFAGPANAADVRLFKENFGTAAQPTFVNPQSLAVDRSNNDLLVVEGGRTEQQSLTVSATAGQFKLTLAGPTVEYWAGTGTIACDGSSTTITGAVDVTGSLTATLGGPIVSTPASCIKPGTTIASVSGTTITLSQSTEANASGGTVNLVAERATNLTTGWTGSGTITCNGTSTAITNVATTTGAASKGEEISSTPASCIKPGTTIASVSATTITLSQATESNANGGTVNLSAELPFNVSTEDLQGALQKLSSIGLSNVTVTGGPGSASGSSPYLIVFQGFRGALSGRAVAEIVAQNGAIPLSGGSGASVTTTTQGMNGSVQRFKPNGEPDPFPALGTHIIDAEKGPGGKPCGEEASSCDVPPFPAREGLGFGAASKAQITVDNSGGVTDGNIYLTQAPRDLVNVFAGDGHHLGQIKGRRSFSQEQQKITFSGTWANGNTFVLGNLPSGCSATATASISYASIAGNRTLNINSKMNEVCGEGSFGVTGSNAPAPPNSTLSFQQKYEALNQPQLSCAVVSGSGTCGVATLVEGGVPSPTPTPLGAICGVAVDPAGGLYLGGDSSGNSSNLVHRYVPSASLPQSNDNTANFNRFVTKSVTPCNLSSGAAGTAGSVFVTSDSGAVGPAGVKKLNSATGAFEYLVAPGINTTVAVNPSDGHVFAAAGNVATEYDASGASGATQLSILNAPSAIQGLAINASTGRAYVARSGGSKIEIYGTPEPTPTVAASAASEVSATKATLNGTVDAEGAPIVECFFEYGPTTAYGSTRPCAESVPGDSSLHPVSAVLSGLLPSATYHYRLVAVSTVGRSDSADKTLTTGGQVITEAAGGVGATAATLHGSLNPAGHALTECKFEYLTDAAFVQNGKDYSGPSAPQIKACSPAAGSIDPDFVPHSVSGALGGLAKNTTYHFRLVVANSSGTIVGGDMTFTTLGPPQVIAQFAEARRTGTGFLARINPSGFATTYRFEWGTDVSYGNRVPADVDLFLGSGNSPVNVTADIGGLQENTTYHFRVVATNASGIAKSPDSEFTTLNSAGLPDDRGIELVSPADKQPQGSVRIQLALFNTLRVAEDGQSVLFPLLGGLADTDSGGDAAYLAKRSPSSWQSTKVSPPSLVPAPTNGLLGNASSGLIYYFSPDLSCGIVNTFNPLTADVPAADKEFGVSNLYVRHEDGTHTLITDRVPTNPEIPPVDGLGLPATLLAGASDDCSKVYFESAYDFLPGASGLYEWDSGTLRDPGRLPNGAGALGVGPQSRFISGLFQPIPRLNSVSSDGSRFTFKALSNESATPNVPAVFVRKDGGTVVEASRRQGGSAHSLGAKYEIASPDGHHVFFLATYGLTPDSSSGPLEDCTQPEETDLKACDLYDYDVDTDQLTNLSATDDPANTRGAVAKGVLAVSEDGESVYFAARGQLIPGRGRTYAENVAGSDAVQTANVYLSRDGQLSFVATIAKVDMQEALFSSVRGLRSHVTPDGDRLLFEASTDVIGYDSGGVREAYLYSADSDTTVCISCRLDGLPSVGAPASNPEPTKPLTPTASLLGRLHAISDDGSRAFFTMPDVLAPGAVSGNRNIYQWEEGQIHLLLSGAPGGSPLGGYYTELFSASPSGEDVFIRSPEQLTPFDKDLVLDLYDFRVGGGFAPPPPPPVPCNPAADECQGTPTPQPAAPGAASNGFTGPGNPPAPAEKPAKSKKKKKKAKKQRKRAHGRSHSRAANTNRGGAK